MMSISLIKAVQLTDPSGLECDMNDETIAFLFLLAWVFIGGAAFPRRSIGGFGGAIQTS